METTAALCPPGRRLVIKTLVCLVWPGPVRVDRTDDRPRVTSTDRRPEDVTVVRVVLKRSRCVRVEPTECPDRVARVREVVV